MRKIILGGGAVAIIAASAAIAAITASDSTSRADLDKDGKATLAEMQQRTAERFKRLDVNGDGVVTMEERRSARENWRGSRGSRHRQGDGKSENWPDAFFSRLDGDGNGTVSLAEFNARSAERFARLDVNKDGQITRDEFGAGREAFRGRHRNDD